MNKVYVTIGEVLKRERMLQGLSLEAVSQQTKITVANLELIEEGEVDSLPSQLYYNLFAKAYAELLGIDYNATLEAIKVDVGEPLENAGNRKSRDRASKKEKPQTERPAEAGELPEQAGRKVALTLAYLVGGVIVVFLLFLLIRWALPDGEQQFAEGDTATVAGEHEQLEVDSIHEKTDAGDTQTSVTRGSEDEYATYNWGVPAYKPPENLTLRLLAQQESWATVVADGDTAIFRTLKPGREYTVEAKFRIKISIAVPSAVSVKLNGEPVDLRQARSGRISRVEITQLNVDSVLGAGNPTEEQTTNESTPASSEFTSEKRPGDV
ncbi:MAG: RodZ domain-containing protein [Candidatus Zixiibacteriota bacterium]